MQLLFHLQNSLLQDRQHCVGSDVGIVDRQSSVLIESAFHARVDGDRLTSTTHAVNKYKEVANVSSQP